MNEIKKEILTNEQIIRDLLRMDAGRTSHESDLFPYIPLSLMLGLIGQLLLDRWWIGVIFGSIAILLSLRLIPDAKAAKARKQSILDGGFTVLSDTLNAIEEDVPERRYSYSRGKSYISHADDFHFSSACWRVRRTQRFYEWSELYCLSLKGLKNTSIPGDEFYVVVIGNDPHITCAYNKKLFTYVSEKGDPQ